MVAPRERPGVSVVQKIQTTAPSIVRPQLVPCNVAPFFEVIEVYDADGRTVNADSQFATLYRQQALSIPQLSFPNPRGNIDELDVQEDSLRVFFNFGNQVLELSRTSGFLASLNVATQAFIDGTVAGPFNIPDNTSLVVQFDSHTAVGSGLPSAGSIPAASYRVIAIEAGDGVPLDAVLEQINAIVPGAAIESPLAAGRLRLQSSKFGAGSSVSVRAAGSANAIFGFPAAPSLDTVAVGAGLYAIDDGDGDVTSPRLEVFLGTTQRAVNTGNVPAIGAVNFVDLNVRAGDDVFADGGAIGKVDQVYPTRLVMRVEQNLFSQALKFSPRFVWMQANGLTFPQTTSTKAQLTATVPATPASTAFVVGLTQPTLPIGPGETLNVDVTVQGDPQPTEVINSGEGWGTDSSLTTFAQRLAATVDLINAQALNFVAFPANRDGDQVAPAQATRLGFRVLGTNAGSGGAISVTSLSPSMNVGFTQALPVSDVGENARYRVGSPARAQAATNWAAVGPAVSGNTVIYTPTINGVARPQETITWSASHPANPTGLAAAIADWNAQALYSSAYEANAQGVLTQGGGFLAVRTMGEATGADTALNVTGGTAVAQVGGAVNRLGQDTDLSGREFQWLLDNNPQIFRTTLVADEDDGGVSQQSVVAAVNAVTPGQASVSEDGRLVLTSAIVGEGSAVQIGNGASANAVLGFTAGDRATGNGRPNPDMAIAPTGELVLQAQQLRDPRTGEPFANVTAPMYAAYRALRLDLSPRASNPGLVLINNTTHLQSVASPISVDNPGALMTYFSLLNSPGVSSSAVGVPEISADAPDGTPIGYSECFEFMESEEVYAIALGTQNPLVHQAAVVHVDFMSDARQKGERIVFLNAPEPNRDLPTVLGSGTDANTTATPGEVYLEGNVAAALVAAGIDPLNVNPATGAIRNEIYLNLGTDDRFYLVRRVTNGNQLELRTAISDAQDTEAFFARTPPSGVISASWSIELRGTELVQPGTRYPDRNRIADTVARTAQSYNNRRVFYTFPDRCVIAPSGLNQEVPGYYATACLIGMVAGLPPQQPFTNMTVSGLVSVPGSNDTYSNRQLEVMGGGGAFMLVQDVRPGGPVTIWHQLSTDTSSIARQELSVTKVVDYTAKFLRRGLRQFIGRRNITQTFLDEFSSILDGLLEFLKNTGVLISASVERVVQDASAPDTILVDVVLDVPFPCNYVRVTLVV